jgi:hypothetical protein
MNGKFTGRLISENYHKRGLIRQFVAHLLGAWLGSAISQVQHQPGQGQRMRLCPTPSGTAALRTALSRQHPTIPILSS